ncbi:hypothetical protein [Skermania sp. ID1734]|uniref:hypothetical protein n=1 Tax=Skermania sp. ID1734 TaxID=2597516 RepID=UPI00163DC149|nr:hypothetical protein [Skermania sp. ID1734]
MSGKPRPESDVTDDEHVATSKESGESEDPTGSHVGRVGSDDAIDEQESGAEARAQRS